MREFVGALIGINGVAVAVFLLRDKTVDWKGFLAISLVSVILCVVVANSQNITQLAVKGEKVGGVTVNIERQVKQVETRAQEVEQLTQEVRDLKSQTQLLVDNANSTNEKITSSEKNVQKLSEDAVDTKKAITGLAKQAEAAVSAVKTTESNVALMRDSVRQTWRSLLESYFYVVSTRNIFPIPQAINVEINRHLNILAAFAYPDDAERAREITRMQNAVQQAMPKPAQPPH